MSSSQVSLFENKKTELDSIIEQCTNMLKSCAVGRILRRGGALIYRSEIGFDFTSGKYRIYAKFTQFTGPKSMIIMDGKNGWKCRRGELGLMFSADDGVIDHYPPEFLFPFDALNSIDVFNYEMKYDMSIPFDKEIFFSLLDYGKWFNAK